MGKCDICDRQTDYITSTKIGKLCPKHYQQYYKYGKPIDNNPYSIKDKNEIILYDDYAEIILRDKYGSKTGSAIIDLEDVDLCKKYKWRKWKDSVFTGNNINNNDIISLYHFIYQHYHKDCISSDVIDHINGNRFDCRKNNLRKCEQRDNVKNKRFMSNNTSGIIGVRYDKERDEYVVEIRNNTTRYRCRYNLSFDEAVYVRYLLEQKVFKDFRHTTNDKEYLKYINHLTPKIKQELEEYVERKIYNTDNHVQEKIYRYA